MKRCACSSPSGTRLSRSESAPFDALGDRLGARRVRADGRVAAGLVERRMGRGNHRRPARHRLDDRDPEALEERRVGERRCAAVEAGSCSSGTNPSAVTPSPPSSCSRPLDRRARRRRARARAAACGRARAPRPARTGSCAARASQRRGRTGVRARPCGPSGVYRSSTPGIRDRDPLARKGERLRATSSAVNSRDREDQVAGLRRVRVLAPVHPPGQRRHPFRDGAAATGRRPSSSAARRAARGYIQSEKWKTSSCPASRSTFGKPSRLQAVLQVCDGGGDDHDPLLRSAGPPAPP